MRDLLFKFSFAALTVLFTPNLFAQSSPPIPTPKPPATPTPPKPPAPPEPNSPPAPIATESTETNPIKDLLVEVGTVEVGIDF